MTPGPADEDDEDFDFDDEDDLAGPEMTPEEEAAQAAAYARNRQRWANYPHHYEWTSPVGVFRISRHDWELNPARVWVLSVDFGELGAFADPIKPMELIHEKRTAYAPWDNYAGDVEPPENDRDWEISL
jgi:hypothetical protein